MPVMPSEVVVALERSVLPESVVDDSVALAPNTSAPEPVSFVTSDASSADVSIEELEILLLNADQSVALSLPVFDAEAMGRLNVMVSADAVTVKSLPEVEVAKVMDVPDCGWPAGPIWAMLPPPPEPHAEPVPETVPEEFIWRHCVEAVVMPEITRLVVLAVVAVIAVVEANAMVALGAVRPPLNAICVVVALLGNGYAKSPVTCDDGSERFGSVVMEAIELVAARSVTKRVSKSPLNVVVYTPLVTVPALPVMLPLMVLLKVFVPEKVLLFARSVEDAAVTVTLAVPSKVTPFIVRPVWSAVAVEALPVSEPVRPPLKAMLVEVAFEGNG